jgi:hypothetical protein
MPDNPYQRSDPTWWDSVKDNLGALDVNDLTGFPQWLAGATRPAPESQGWGPEAWKAQADWQREQMDTNPMAFVGMTKILGAPGGSRTIQAFHDRTGQALGSLGYRDVPGKGAIFQSIESQSPRGTAELLGRFRDEMGPLMNEVKVPGPIKAQSVPAFEAMLNRGRLNEYPDLAKRLRSVLDESRANYGDLIPENTYQWNKYQR